MSALDDVRSKDRDETRRLCYMALAASRTTKYNIVGTLTNALAHHSGLVEDPYELLEALVRLVEHRDEEATALVRGFITELSQPPDEG